MLTCAAHLLVQTKRANGLAEARTEAEGCLASGKPLRKWEEMLAAQGADLDAYHKKLAADHAAPVLVELKAEQPGTIGRCDARITGEVIRDLGGGRLTKDTALHYDVGVEIEAKPGDRVGLNSPLARIHARNVEQAQTMQQSTAIQIIRFAQIEIAHVLGGFGWQTQSFLFALQVLL